MKISFQNLTEYFKEQIMLNNSMFIYSFIYLSESNAFSESDFLKNLVNPNNQNINYFCSNHRLITAYKALKL